MEAPNFKKAFLQKKTNKLHHLLAILYVNFPDINNEVYLLFLKLTFSATGIQLFQNMFFFICGYEDSPCLLTNCKVEFDNNQT